MAEDWGLEYQSGAASVSTSKLNENEDWGAQFAAQTAPKAQTPIGQILGFDVDNAILERVKSAYQTKAQSDYDLNLDQERMAQGQLPSAYDKKYKGTEQDNYLYSQGLPSASEFTEYYNKAAAELNKEQAPKQQYDAIVKEAAKFAYANGKYNEQELLDFISTVLARDDFSDLREKIKTPVSGSEREFDSAADQAQYDIVQSGKPEGYSFEQMLADIRQAAANEQNRTDGEEAATSTVSQERAAREKVMAAQAAEQNRYDGEAAGAAPSAISDDLDVRLAQGGPQQQQYLRDRSKARQDIVVSEADAAAKDIRMQQQGELDEALKTYLPESIRSVDRGNYANANPYYNSKDVYDERVESAVDAFRNEMTMSGKTGLEIDNAIRRANLGKYISGDTEIKNYVVDMVERSGYSRADGEAYFASLNETEKSNYLADMQFDDRVQNSLGDEAARAIISIPARTAVELAAGVVNFADMVAGSEENGISYIADQLNEAAFKMRQYGTNTNHEYLNYVSDVGSEVLKMYALNAAGMFAASAAGIGTGVGASLMTADKGIGAILNYGLKSSAFVADAMGGYFSEAMAKGASRAEATTYGLLAGTAEGLVEKLSASEMFNKTISASIVKKMVPGTKTLLTTYGMAGINLLTSSIGEGIEEGASYWVSGLLEKAIFNPEWTYNKDAFLNDMLMGAITGGVGSAATFGETSRVYQNLQDMVDNGYTPEKMDALMAAVEVESMPEAKVADRIAQMNAQARKIEGVQKSPVLTREEYAAAVADETKATQAIENAKTNYENQLAANNEKVKQAEKARQALYARADAISASDPTFEKADTAKKLAAINDQIAAANRAYYKLKQDVKGANENARKERDGVTANNTRIRDVARRRLDDHNIAYDLSMQLQAARQDIERGITELEQIEQEEARVYDRIAVETDASVVAALEDQLDYFGRRREELRDQIDEGLHTEDWAKLENSPFLQKWYADAEWQTTLGKYAQQQSRPSKRNVKGVKVARPSQQAAEARTTASDATRTNIPTSAQDVSTGRTEAVQAIPEAVQTEQAEILPLGANVAGQTETKTSKVYSNTYNALFDEAEMQMMDEEDYQYDVVTEKQSLEEARTRLEQAGVEQSAGDLRNNPNWSSADLDTAMGILSAYRAEAAETKDYSKVRDWASIIQEHGTQGGQMIQAFAKYSRTPEGKAVQLKKIADGLNKQYQKQIESGKMQPIQIDEGLIDDLYQAVTQEEIDAAELAVAKHVAAQIPASLADKIVAWRYLSMLGNPRTHARNILGNAVMWAARQAKDVVATGIESIAIKDKSQRTKALSSERTSRDYAKTTWGEASKAMKGNKFGVQDLVQQNRTIFKSKALEAVRNFNMNALEWEDLALFAQPAYIDAFAKAMKARGLTAETINTKQSLEIQQIALDEAMRATFRDASKLADLLNQIEKSGSVGQLIVSGTIPFKKTPINILKRGIEYSPVGLVSGLTKSLYNVKQGNITAAQAIDRISAGAVGTGLMALGAMLAKSGILRASGDDDDTFEYYQKDLGQQPYSVRIGDSTFTIDWITPASMPLFAGAELFTAAATDEAIDVGAIFDALAQTTDPLMQLSMLQGINDALTSIGNDELGGGVGAVVGNAMSSYALQFVPTVLGQVSRTIDPTRRTTTGEKDSPLGIDSVARKAANKTPLSVLTEPYVDKWGNEQVNENHWAVRLLENTLLPGYVNNIDMTNVDVELTRVYMSTQERDALPSRPQRTLTEKGETYTMTPTEYTQYQKALGKAVYSAVDAAISTYSYDTMDDDDKAKRIKKAIEGAENKVRKEYKKKFKLIK